MQVFKAKVWIEAKPWVRVAMDGTPHNHGKNVWLMLKSFMSRALEVRYSQCFAKV